MIEALNASGYVVMPAGSLKKLEETPAKSEISPGTPLSLSTPIAGIGRGSLRGFVMPGGDIKLKGSSHIASATPAPLTTTVVPKVPFFSGDDPMQKGEVTYYERRFEVKCLIPENPPAIMVQTIRRSL